MDISYCFLTIIFFLNYFYLCFAYKEYKLEGYDLCANKKLIKPILDLMHGGPEIELKNGRESAALITQTWDSKNPRKIKSNCSFRIKSKKPNGGIYIVLTKLRFRKDPVTNKCIDYIEFSQSKSQRNHISRTCEKYGSNDTNTTLLFNDRGNEVFVTVSVNLNIEIIEPLELVLIATSHYECELLSSNHNNHFQCNRSDPYSCISEYFVDDGFKNCMPPCRDEIDCSLQPVTVEIVDASNVALTAITSLIFTMVGIGTCLWLCWQYKGCTNLNQQQQQQQNNSNSNNDHRRNENVHQNSEISQNNRRVVVNGVETEQRPPSPKEDLPPSYESLFPDR